MISPQRADRPVDHPNIGDENADDDDRNRRVDIARVRDRSEPRYKQIELLENFAAQAVIAIENARLLNELRQRTTDLTERTADEALEQQTATSEVLQVISSSPGHLEPVFAAMVEKAVRICEALFGNIYRWDGDALTLVATHNTPPAFAEALKRSPVRPEPDSIYSRAVATKTVVHVLDTAERRALSGGRPPGGLTLRKARRAELGGRDPALSATFRHALTFLTGIHCVPGSDAALMATIQPIDLPASI